MIFDNIKNSRNYLGLNQLIDVAIGFLQSADLESMPCGKYEVLADKVYALVQEYGTKTKTALEVHRKYIDVHYMISGEEKTVFSDISKCSNSFGYDDETDAEFFGETLSPPNYVYMRKGDFLIFFPNDAHTATKDGKEKTVKKVVIKVAI